MYEPIDAAEVARFIGLRTFMRLPHIRPVEAPHPVDVAFVGLPFDTGATFRTGTRFGPSSIREASLLLRPYSWTQKVRIFDYLSVVDAGDAPVIPGSGPRSMEAIDRYITETLDPARVIPIGLGGDHTVALGELRALARVHGPLSLIHFDSHVDTWDEYWGEKITHGTPFRRAVEEGLIDPARSIQIGMRGPMYSEADIRGSEELGFLVVPTEQMIAEGIPATVERIRRRVGQSKAFLSFDIDFVDPAYAPGTGTPEVGGPTSRETLDLLNRLTGIAFVGMDVVEVLPAYDPGMITAELAANIAWTYLALLAKSRSGAGEGNP